MMKTIALTFALLSPIAAFAQPVTLRPGSTAVINGDVISCEDDGTARLPVCSLRQDGANYRVLAGSTVVQSYYTFDTALEGVKKIREAGLCK